MSHRAARDAPALPDELARIAVSLALEVGDGAQRCAVEALKVNKSAVFRVAVAVGPALIVKRCALTSGRVEATIYREVLDVMPVAAPRLRSFRELDGAAWLVLEEAGGRPFDPRERYDRALAARWLARTHQVTSELSSVVELPSRGEAYYRSVAEAAVLTLASVRSQDTWPASERPTLDTLDLCLQALLDHWDEIEGVVSAFPVSLVHGGFAGKNVHVANQGGRPQLLPFDWEAGGWGFPAPDLSTADLGAYAARADPARRRALGDATRFGAIGTALWNVAPIPGELPTAQAGYVRGLVPKFAYYRDHLCQALNTLGWWTDTA